MDLGWQGLNRCLAVNLFSGSRLTVTVLIVSSFGNIYEVDVEDEYVVDTGHIVAFEDTLSFDLSKAGSSWINSFPGWRRDCLSL